MKKNARRFWIVTILCAVTALLFLALYRSGYEPLQRLEFYTQDLRMRLGRKTPVDPRLVLIGIDRPSYAPDLSEEDIKANPTLRLLQKNFPWSRVVWADLIQRLADAGAKAIVLDLVFAGEGEGDDAFQRVLDKYRDRVVIGSNIRDLDSDRGSSMALNLPSASVLNSDNSNSPAFDERVGYVNVWSDRDGVLRRARYRLDGAHSGGLLPNGVVMESLDARALRKFGQPELIPQGDEPVRFRYTLAPGFGYRVHPLGDVLVEKTWKQNYQSGEFFRGKVVLIGPTADIFQDTHETPFPTAESTKTGGKSSSGMLGPEIHLNMIGAALHGQFLHETSPGADLMFVAMAGLVAAVLSFFVHQPLRRLILITLLCVGYWFWCQHLFNHANLVVPVASPLLVLTISGVFVLAYDYFLEQFERARVRKTLERYVSKDIVKELLDNPETYFNSLVGVRRPVTVLFSDVRGFTTLTEEADSPERSAMLVKQLNEYFEEMVRHVFSHQGSLDKFIGDAVMAVWGNIISHGTGRDAQQAVATALAMRHSLAKLNVDWKARGWKELAFGIGINHGEVIVGNLGSTEKMELTVIGDPVNLASRLESLTKRYHLDLLIGEAMAKLVGEQFILRTVDCVQVKGKTKPVDVFTVMGDGAAQTVSLPVWLARYEDGVRLYRARSFEKALAAFEECSRRQPDDYLNAMYTERCHHLIANPPDESWNGVYVLSEK